jgi:hypothetical protein
MNLIANISSMARNSWLPPGRTTQLQNDSLAAIELTRKATVKPNTALRHRTKLERHFLGSIELFGTQKRFLI